MATRGFRRLRPVWTTCQQGAHHRGSWLQQARVFSTPKIISPQAISFTPQWRVLSPQFTAFSAESRAFSAQAASKESTPAVEAAAGGEKAAVKKRRRKKKTFLEVAQFLPNWGLGARFTKSHWPAGNFYKVTKVKVYKSGTKGAAWGVFHQDEAAKTGEVQKIGGVNKRCWRYVPDMDLSAIVWKRSAAERPVKPVPLTLADA